MAAGRAVATSLCLGTIGVGAKYVQRIYFWNEARSGPQAFSSLRPIRPFIVRKTQRPNQASRKGPGVSPPFRAPARFPTRPRSSTSTASFQLVHTVAPQRCSSRRSARGQGQPAFLSPVAA